MCTVLERAVDKAPDAGELRPQPRVEQALQGEVRSAVRLGADLAGVDEVLRADAGADVQVVQASAPVVAVHWIGDPMFAVIAPLIGAVMMDSAGVPRLKVMSL